MKLPVAGTKLISALPLLLACACGSNGGGQDAGAGPDPDAPTRPPDDPAPYVWTNSVQELDLLEAVFRYQFEHNASGDTGRDSIFLALGRGDRWQDPSPELIARFARHVPEVGPWSAADTSGPGVEHEETGGRGIIFRIERIRHIDDETVDVDGGYYSGNLNAAGYSYRVKQRGSAWVVVRDAMWWIS